MIYVLMNIVFQATGVGFYRINVLLLKLKKKEKKKNKKLAHI